MVTAYIVWPEVLDGSDADEEVRDLPGRGAAPPNWANWISMIIDDDPEPTLRALGCDALLAYTTEGLPAEKIEWATPEQLITAADRLSDLIRGSDEVVNELVEVYEDFEERGGQCTELLVEDLAVVKRLGQSLARLGKTKIAFNLAF
jgi:hypothetical protein